MGGEGLFVSYTDWSFHCSRGTKFSKEQKKRGKLFPVESPWSTFVPPGGANANSSFQAPFFHASFRKRRGVSWLSCQPGAVIWYKGTAVNWTTGLTYVMWHKGCILRICKIRNKLRDFVYRLVQTMCKKKFLSCFRLYVHIILSYWVINFWRCSILFESRCINLMK